MAWWKLWGRRAPINIKDAETWVKYFGESDGAGELVNSETAKKVSAWWRGIRLYADVAGTCSLKFYERQANDERVRNTDHPVAGVIGSDPNFDNTAKEFWSAQAVGLCTYGNAYAEKITSGSRLTSLELLPFETIPKRDENNILTYEYYDRGKRFVLPREKVFHVRSFYEGGDEGVSPLMSARRSLGVSLATERAVAQTFSRGMRAKGFFTVPQLLTPDQRTQTYKTLVDPFSGPNGKDWGVLEAGFDIKTVHIQPKDAEMLLNRRYNVEDVCRWLGLPPILVGHAADGQTMWGAGVENIILSWRTLGLDSFLSDIETAINKRLLSPQERRRYYAEYDRDSLMQADSASRSAILNAWIQNAQLTPNEGRKLQNRPRMDGGDQLLINSTLIPLTAAGQRSAAQSAPPQDREAASLPLSVPIFGALPSVAEG